MQFLSDLLPPTQDITPPSVDVASLSRKVKRELKLYTPLTAATVNWPEWLLRPIENLEYSYTQWDLRLRTRQHQIHHVVHCLFRYKQNLANLTFTMANRILVDVDIKWLLPFDHLKRREFSKLETRLVTEHYSKSLFKWSSATQINNWLENETCPNYPLDSIVGVSPILRISSSRNWCKTKSCDIIPASNVPSLMI